MIICVCGPTGVGKTKMSIALAKKYNGIIINCDAMQVYKGLDIGTAKVTEEEKEKVKHYLLDFKDVQENYTVYDYQKDIRKLINDNQERNIIIVGGTGLYLKAALYDYQFNEEENNNTYEDLTNQELYELCLKKDANMNIHLNNRKRLIRFLNKTNNSYNKDKLLYDNVYFIGLTTDRENLYQIINKRVDKMFKEGLVSEVKQFYDQKIKSKALMTAIGYKELYSYFDGDISLEEAKDKIKQNSRHYAKRQYTWYKNQMNIHWFNVDYQNFDLTIKEVIKYLQEKRGCNEIK